MSLSTKFREIIFFREKQLQNNLMNYTYFRIKTDVSKIHILSLRNEYRIEQKQKTYKKRQKKVFLSGKSLEKIQ